MKKQPISRRNTKMENNKPETMRPVRWGVLGTAGIAAGCTIPGMQIAEGCEPYAIAGRSPLGRAKLLNDPEITKIAAKYCCSAAKLLLRYLNQRGIPVIPKASSKERMLENLDIFGFTISADDMSYLSCLPERGWSGEHPDL
jgi:hypothetical protein